MTDNLIESLKREIGSGAPLSRTLRNELAACSDPSILRSAGRALAKLDPATSGLRLVRVGVLGTATAGPLEHFLRATLVGAGLVPQFTVADYGSFDLALANGDEPALSADHDVVVCVLHDGYLLPRDFAGNDVNAVAEFVTQRAEALRTMLVAASERSGTPLLVHTVPLSSSVRNSFVSWRDRALLNARWTSMNAALLELPEVVSSVHAFDFVADLADAGVATSDERLRQYADIPYTDAAYVIVADEVRRFLQAKAGLSRKVLALDLDNTLWGGVLGEVGASGITLGGLYPGKSFKELQRAAARLRDQGVILAVASKNDNEHVDTTLREHPEVVLRPEHFSAVAVNWQPKIENLRQIAEQLDLGIDSFVFMDDSPFERGHITAELPEVAVLASDGDPAYLVRSLLTDGYFDTLQLTDTDRNRPSMYRARVERTEFAGGFGSSADYLRALELCVTVSVASEFEVPRIAQLAARTNQFNLTGIRYSEAETAKLIADPDHLVFSWSVRDRFGDEGIVGAAWVARGDIWVVENFVMSCRVLGRGVELAVVGWVAQQAAQHGARALEGRFVPSARNSVSADLWAKAGFARLDEPAGDADRNGDGPQRYQLNLGDGANPTPDWITLEERWPQT